MNKTRLEAFSDGVLAIIITIMVLEIRLPGTYEWAEIKVLLRELEAYAISFVSVGIYWGNHHHLLHTVKKVNSKIIWSNMLLLFFLSLIPFATRWMAEKGFDSVTVTLYSALLLLCGVAYNILQVTIQRHYPLGEKMNEALRLQNRKGLISLCGYVAAVAAGFFMPLISEILFIGVSVLWIVPDKNIEKAMEEEG